MENMHIDVRMLDDEYNMLLTCLQPFPQQALRLERNSSVKTIYPVIGSE